MRLLNFVAIIAIAIFSVSCGDKLKVEHQVKEITIEEGQLTLSVSTEHDLAWRVESSADWCDADKNSGNDKSFVVLALEPNYTESSRDAIVNIYYEGSTSPGLTLVITQGATKSKELPVVFHVMYTSKDDASEYITASRFKEIIDDVNELYDGKLNGIDMGLEFVLADTDKYGAPMEYAGVNYVQTDVATLDIEAFMNSGNEKDIDMIWDPNRYINVFVTKYDIENLLGISHMAITQVGANELEGTPTTGASFISASSYKYPHCLSLNSKYIYEESSYLSVNPASAVSTLAHELGHYLGLYHVFSEGDEGYADSDDDTDYCDDTESYNRVSYEKSMREYLDSRPSTLLPLFERTNSDGTFTSYNVMDYSYTYANRFSEDQRDRVRHILNYGLSVPRELSKTRVADASSGKIDIPFIVMKSRLCDITE